MKFGNLKSFLKFLLFFAAAAWILHTFAKNFVVDPQFKKFLAERVGQASGAAWFWILRAHIALAIVALFAGLFGFVEPLRKQNIKLHRFAGRIYVISILLNLVPSIYLAFFAVGGWRSATGFLLLDLIWGAATFQAYRAVRRKQIAAHRRWMIRSYAITLANLQLYVLKTLLVKVAALNFETSYTIAVWTCWIGGLLIAEIVIRQLSPRADSFSQVENPNAERRIAV